MAKKQWGAPILVLLQFVFLLLIYPYFGIIERFRLVFNGLNIETTAITTFVLESPGVYTIPAVLVLMFVVLLWLWATKRLVGKVVKSISILYVSITVILFLLLFGALFSPQTSVMVSNLAEQSLMAQSFAPLPTGYLHAPSDTARYQEYSDNPLKQVKQVPLSTFGLDVSTGSYANVRRFLNSGSFPPVDSVRVEEMLNYFPILSEETQLEALNNAPFRVAYQLAPSPWDRGKTLLWIAVKATELEYREAPSVNLVFLVDVSGSMNSPERLPLVKSSLKLLVDRLRPEDTVSLVTYANGSRVVLGPTQGRDKATILSAINQLTAGGGTAGSEGIQLAYEQAQKAFIKGGVNRIILCTDGDFNIGISRDEELKAMLTRKREQNVTLSILGYGTHNLNDAMMIKLASVGNGNYSYIDTLSEAQKVLGEEMESTLVVVAKDVKAQIEFNPAVVQEYRQIGYEKRQLKAEDFNNDKVDAGDIGAGKRVTVLYELTLVGQKSAIDPLRYSGDATSGDGVPATSWGDELGYLKLRWKEPDGKESLLTEQPVLKEKRVPSFASANSSLRFSGAVAAFGQKLRNNPQLANTPWKEIGLWAEQAKGSDKGGYRAEFVRMVDLAGSLESTGD